MKIPVYSIALWLFVASLVHAAEPTPRLALIAAGTEPAMTAGAVSLAEVELSREPSLQLLDRATVNALLAEQELSLSNLVNPETAVKAGRMVKADMLVVCEALPGDIVRVVAFDSETGIRLADMIGAPANTADAATFVVTSARKAVRCLGLFHEGMVALGCTPFVSAETGTFLQPSCQTLRTLVMSRLLDRGGVAILERQHMEAIVKESFLSAEWRNRLRASTRLLHAEVERRTGGQELRVTLRLCTLDGNEVWNKAVEGPLNDLSALADNMVKTLLDPLKIAPSSSSVDRSREAKRFIAEARLHQYRKEYGLSVECALIASTLQPDSEEAASVLFRSLASMQEQPSGAMEAARQIVLRMLQISSERKSLEGNVDEGVALFPEDTKVQKEFQALCDEVLGHLLDELPVIADPQIRYERLGQVFVLLRNTRDFPLHLRFRRAWLREMASAPLQTTSPDLHSSLEYMWSEVQVVACLPEQASLDANHERKREWLAFCQEAKKLPGHLLPLIGELGQLATEEGAAAENHAVELLKQMLAISEQADPRAYRRLMEFAPRFLQNRLSPGQWAAACVAAAEPLLATPSADAIEKRGWIITRACWAQDRAATFKTNETERITAKAQAIAYTEKARAILAALPSAPIRDGLMEDLDAYVTETRLRLGNQLPANHHASEGKRLVHLPSLGKDSKTWEGEYLIHAAVRDGNHVWMLMRLNHTKKLRVAGFSFADDRPKVESLGDLEFPNHDFGPLSMGLSMTTSPDAVYVGGLGLGLLRYSRLKESPAVLTEKEGLPDSQICSLCWFDDRLFLGLGNGAVGHGGSLAVLDPARRDFTIIASSRRSADNGPLDGKSSYEISGMVADPAAKCMWFSIRAFTDMNRNGLWRLTRHGDAFAYEQVWKPADKSDYRVEALYPTHEGLLMQGSDWGSHFVLWAPPSERAELIQKAVRGDPVPLTEPARFPSLDVGGVLRSCVLEPDSLWQAFPQGVTCLTKNTPTPVTFGHPDDTARMPVALLDAPAGVAVVWENQVWLMPRPLPEGRAAGQ